MRDIGFECCSALKAGKSFSGNIIRDVRSFPCLSSPLLSSLLMAHTPVHHKSDSASGGAGQVVRSFCQTHHFPRCEHFTKIATVIDDDDGDKGARGETDWWAIRLFSVGGCLRGAGYIFSREEVREEERQIFPSWWYDSASSPTRIVGAIKSRVAFRLV